MDNKIYKELSNKDEKKPITSLLKKRKSPQRSLSNMYREESSTKKRKISPTIEVRKKQANYINSNHFLTKVV